MLERVYIYGHFYGIVCRRLHFSVPFVLLVLQNIYLLWCAIRQHLQCLYILAPQSAILYKNLIENTHSTFPSPVLMRSHLQQRHQKCDFSECAHTTLLVFPFPYAMSFPLHIWKCGDVYMWRRPRLDRVTFARR